jgi:hypothetical protein
MMMTKTWEAAGAPGEAADEGDAPVEGAGVNRGVGLGTAVGACRLHPTASGKAMVAIRNRVHIEVDI